MVFSFYCPIHLHFLKIIFLFTRDHTWTQNVTIPVCRLNSQRHKNLTHTAPPPPSLILGWEQSLKEVPYPSITSITDITPVPARRLQHHVMFQTMGYFRNILNPPKQTWFCAFVSELSLNSASSPKLFSLDLNPKSNCFYILNDWQSVRHCHSSQHQQWRGSLHHCNPGQRGRCGTLHRRSFPFSLLLR